jgi:hypothetical protein
MWGRRTLQYMAPRDNDLAEMRRAWIVAHQGVSIIQQRRAELLGRTLRAQQRATANAVPDPHDDDVIPPLWLRTAKSPASQIELLVVVMAAFIAPAGWVGGLLLKQGISRHIPATLRAFPIAALLWSGVVTGLMIVALYHPASTLWQIVALPWLCLQSAAIPVVAGLYGIAEGWLAIPGSDLWWPLIPAPRPLTAVEAAVILGDYDLFGSRSLDKPSTPDFVERRWA